MAKYRPNVAALVVRSDGKLLVCERIEVSGAWQFPQGGVDEGEAVEEALVREVEEEVGWEAEDYTIEKVKGGYRYDYPEEVRVKKASRKAQYVGQEQTYFLCRLRDGASEVDLTGEPREFEQAKWIDPGEFDLGWLPEFKRVVYQAVMEDFFGVNLGGESSR